MLSKYSLNLEFAYEIANSCWSCLSIIFTSFHKEIIAQKGVIGELKILKKIFAVIFIGFILFLVGVDFEKSIAYNIAKFLSVTIIVSLLMLAAKWLAD